MPVNNAASQPRPFGLRDKLGYFFGDLANNFTFLFAGNYLMKFYTDVLGIAPAAVGVLFVAARFIDAFTDLGMGRLADALPAGPGGRFRPWMLRMAGPMFLANILMYLPGAARLTTPGRIAYMAVTYILWGSLCYTAANIPYGAMASAISPVPAHRTSLSTWRSLGAVAATLPITVLSPLVLFREENGVQVVIPQRFFAAAVVFGALAAGSYLACYHLTTERVTTPPHPVKAERPPTGALLKSLLGNRALLAMVGAALAMLLAQLLTQSMTVYLFSDYFGSAALLSLSSLAGFVPMLALAPLAGRLSARFGKKECSAVGVAIAAVLYGLLYLLRLQNPWIFIALTLAASVGMGFFNMVVWALLTDVIDWQQLRTGRRDDGTIYAVYSFSRKAGQALAGGIGGFALSAIGYVSAAPGQGPVVQSEETLRGIYAICTGVPALAYLVVLVLLVFVYPLNRRQVADNAAALEKKRRGGV